MDLNQWSKIGLAFAVGVSLSAGYVALGARTSEAPSVVVVEERCPEQPAAQLDQLRPPRRATELTHNPLHYGISQTELEAMARDCDLRDDTPPKLSDEIAEALGLSASEREAYARALEKTEAEASELRLGLLRELAPELELAELEPFDQTMHLHELAPKTKQFEDSSVHRHIAEERAGLREPPSAAQLAELSPWARWERFRRGTGERFAAALGEELGAERVDELRSIYGGWPGHGRRHTGCDDVPRAETPERGFSLEGEGLDKQLVGRIVRAHVAEIERCYQLGLADDPRLEGRVELALTIGPDGKVGESRVAEAQLDHEGTKTCMAEAARGWRFPKTRGGETVQFTYPFVLTTH